MDNKTNALAKDEMLAMIRHGANEVFKGKDDEFTDEDVDAIIGRGEERVRPIIYIFYHYLTFHHFSPFFVLYYCCFYYCYHCFVSPIHPFVPLHPDGGAQQEAGGVG